MSNQQTPAFRSMSGYLTGLIHLLARACNSPAAGRKPPRRVAEHQQDTEPCEPGSRVDMRMPCLELPVTRHAVASFRSSTKALFQLGFSWDLLIDMIVRVRFEDHQCAFWDAEWLAPGEETAIPFSQRGYHAESVGQTSLDHNCDQLPDEAVTLHQTEASVRSAEQTSG